MDLRLRQLRHFVEFAETPDFRVLAQRLQIPRSTLIFQIRSLEEEFGAPLIERGQHKMKLTAAGEILLETAKRVLVRLDGLQRRLAEMHGDHFIRICCSQAGQSGVLAELLRLLGEQHSELEVELKILIPDERIQSLLAEEVDLLVMVPPTRAPGVMFHHLRNEPLYALMPETFVGKYGPKMISVHEFAQFPLLLPTEHECRFAREFALSVLRPFSLQPRVINVTTSRQTTLAMVAAGRGVVLSSGSMRGHEAFGLRMVPFRESLPALPLGIAWRQNDSSTALAKMREAVISVAQNAPSAPLEFFSLFATLPASAVNRAAAAQAFQVGASTLSRGPARELSPLLRSA